MKVIAKHIDMVAWFSKEGIPEPVRFKITNKDDTESVIKINSIIQRSEERLAGNNMLIFLCQGVVADKERQFEIKYEINTCKWMLFKI
jgi:hypothetical protein